MKRMQEIAGLITENHDPQDPNTKLFQKVKNWWDNESSNDERGGLLDAKEGSEEDNLNLEQVFKNFDELSDEYQEKITKYLVNYDDDFEEFQNNSNDVDTSEETWDYEMQEGEEPKLKGKMKLSEFKSQLKEMILREKNLKPSKEDKELAGIPSEELETPETPSEGGSDISSIQNHLTQAQEEAKQLGDEKLINQIGNTLVYLVRSNRTAPTQMNEVNYNLEARISSIMDNITGIWENMLDSKEADEFINGLIKELNKLKQ